MVNAPHCVLNEFTNLLNQPFVVKICLQHQTDQRPKIREHVDHDMVGSLLLGRRQTLSDQVKFIDVLGHIGIERFSFFLGVRRRRFFVLAQC